MIFTCLVTELTFLIYYALIYRNYFFITNGAPIFLHYQNKIISLFFYVFPDKRANLCKKIKYKIKFNILIVLHL